MLASDGGYFERLRHQQVPDILWIGCSDSRVPANVIAGLDPGEVFVHRNIANVVPHTDLNVLTVLAYAVEVLGVEHVIVCGHYGCGGIAAALGTPRHDLSDAWLRHIRDVARTHDDDLAARADPTSRAARLAELNAIEQARNVCGTSIVQGAWAHGRPLSVRAWIYGIDDGLLRDLGFEARGADRVDESYRVAVAGTAA